MLKPRYTNDDLREYRKESENRSYTMCEYEAPADVCMNPHWHTSIELILVLNGELHVTVEGNKQVLSAGDLLYVSSAQIHALEYKAGTRVLSLQISFVWLYKIVPDFLKVSVELNPRNVENPIKHQIYEGVVRSFLLLKDLFYSEEKYAHYGVNGYVFLILYQLITYFRTDTMKTSKEVYRYEKQIRHLLQYLYENYQQDITLQDMADELFVSPQYVSKLFRQHFAMNYKQYLTKIRLEHAVYEMIHTKESMLDISIKCGFSSQHVFIDAFKKKYHMTPGEFRKLYEAIET